MTKHLCAGLVAFLAAAFLMGAPVAPASAQAVNETGISGPGGQMPSISANDLVAILRELGLPGSTDTDGNGDPMVVGNIEGINYLVYFQRCNDQKQCFDIRFNASFNFDKRVTLHMMNVFNSRATFGQAYIARDGSVNIDMAATVQGGVSRQYVKEVIDWWKVTVTQFEQNLFSG
ncbi:MAG TPA: YbjN domain-containing protein [Micropepsaceae bacterium]|nr:YbjN domain-containing protein [Micropepsaceae bacterium]HRK71489.1 YbjN domain-containing protein [Micropepsaceae bacterium]